MRKLLVASAKVVGKLAIIAGLVAVASVMASLVIQFFIDGSEPKNPGTDLGAGLALGMMLMFIALPASVFGGIVLAARYLFGMNFGDMLRSARST